MKYYFMVFLLFLFSTGVHAAEHLPPMIDFIISAHDASEIAGKEFCNVTAATETFNHAFGGSTKSESLQMTCDGKTYKMGGEVSEPGFEQRVNEILSQAMGQLLKMGFKVVSCEAEKKYYKASCTIAKQVFQR